MKIQIKKILNLNLVIVLEFQNIYISRESKESMPCHYWYFIDLGYKFEPYLCNGCQAVSVTVYEVKNIAILNGKGFD